MSELTATLQKSKVCEQLWQKARLEATQIEVRLEVDDHAVCLEGCPRALEEAGAVRVHAQLALVRYRAPWSSQPNRQICSAARQFCRKVAP